MAILLETAEAAGRLYGGEQGGWRNSTLVGIPVRVKSREIAPKSHLAAIKRAGRPADQMEGKQPPELCMDSADLFEPEAAEDGRSAPDLATLLVELARVVKGRAFYQPGDPKLASLFQRGFRAWQGDLQRHGALELEIGPKGFWSSRSRSAIARSELGGLAAEFSARGLHRVRFEMDIDAEALAAFVELLAIDRAVIEASGGFERALYARVPAGIVVNGAPPKLEAKEPEAAEAVPVESGAEATTLDLVEELEIPPLEADLELACAPDLASDRGRAAGPDEPPTELQRSRTEELDEAPLEHAISDTRSAELVDLLREMDDCDEQLKYADIARRVVAIAEQLSAQGRLDDSYRVILELARHAGDDLKRSASQAELAAEYLSSLATGIRLEDLIDRACAPGVEASVRATQVLLQLGEEVVPTLLELAEREPDRDRRGQMHGILIVMGEKALPSLLEAMESSEPGRVRSAIRIAGESQNPGAVPRLAEILVGEEAVLREESGKALVRIGDPSALDALISALNSEIAGVPALATYCLAASASRRAVDPLLHAMREAMRSRQAGFAREAIRALGRLGRPEATEALAELLLCKSIFKRRRWRELKVAAASALGRIPGDDAVGALAQASGSRDSQLRRAAQTALDRRAKALTGG
jgi:HEAT repeat protein